MNVKNIVGYYDYVRKEMIPFLPDRQDVVLEVGCGAGGFLQNLEVLEIWGVEPDQEAANIAAKHYTRIFNNHYEETAADIPDEYFDLVICNDVIEHLDDHDKFLSSIHSKLKHGGKLVGSVPNVRYYANLYELIVEKDWQYVDTGILDRTHLRFFTETSLRRALVGAGFRIEIMQGINSALKPRGQRRLRKHALLRLLSLVSLGNLNDIQWLQFGFRAMRE